MELNRVEVGYCTRNGKPKIHIEWRDSNDVVIIDENGPQAGDIMLADRDEYDTEMAAYQAASDAVLAGLDAQEAIDLAAINALKTSGQANLMAGNPLTADEAYVMMNGKLPPSP